MTRVAAGIIERNGRYLVCQRKAGGRYEFKWEFPGGKLEPGETVEQCLRRELHEELSIDVTHIEPYETRTTHYESGGYFEVAFCRVNGFGGDPKNIVFQEIRWASAEEMAQLDFLEGNKPIVERLRGQG